MGVHSLGTRPSELKLADGTDGAAIQEPAAPKVPRSHSSSDRLVPRLGGTVIQAAGNS